MTSLKHTALVCASEKNADRFYKQLLGLNKEKPKILPQSLSMAIFNVAAELKIINYTGEGAHFEIFIYTDKGCRTKQIEHTCIEVNDRKAFFEACREHELDVNRVQKGEKTLLFVNDFDGNLFEVKNRQ